MVVNVHLISQMLQASLQLYRKAYHGLPRSIWWLSLVIFINRCGTMVIPFLTVYLTDKGYTLEQAGYVMAAFGTGAILGSFLGGRLTDRFGFHQIQFFSLLLNGILFIVLGQMRTFWQIAICIFVLSSLGEAFRPANSAAVAAYSDDGNRTRSYSLNRLAINLGWAIGPAVGGILASINYTWLFWVDGLTCIFAAVLLHYVLAPGKAKLAPSTTLVDGKGSSAYKDKVFLQGMIGVLLVSICFFQLFTMIPVYYKDELHLNKAVIGSLMALNGVLIVMVEMILVYKLEIKGRMVRYIIWGTFLIGLSFVMLNIAPVFMVALGGVLTVTLGEMLLFPFLNNFWIRRSSEQNRGQYAAIYNVAFALGNVLAPTLASQIATRFGFPSLWTVDFILCTFAALGFFMLRKRMFSYE
jgi:predicted MFS family arabinose efflux permease